MQLLRFTAKWCGPCKVLATEFEKVNTNIPIKVIDIDDDEARYAERYCVMALPTTIYVDEDGEELARFVGLRNCNEIAKFITGVE